MGKKIERWQADDGKVFHTESQMLRHEKWKLSADSFKPIYGSSDGCRIHFSDFCEWAEENREWLKTYLESVESGPC